MFDFGKRKKKEELRAPKVVAIEPRSFDDVERAIDFLREGEGVLVDLRALREDTALRTRDMLSGAVYALGGSAEERGPDVFLFSPAPRARS